MATLRSKDVEKRHDDGSSTVERMAIVDGRGREIVADVVDETWRRRLIEAFNRTPADGTAERLLLDIKNRAEHVRRFTPIISGGPTEESRLLCSIEADIEEWFAASGMPLYDHEGEHR